MSPIQDLLACIQLTPYVKTGLMATFQRYARASTSVNELQKSTAHLSPGYYNNNYELDHVLIYETTESN